MSTYYKLIEEKKIDELNGIGQLYEHEKSGARVLVIKNDDRNKTFSIAFRTPPADDTGLPHILEHSVLCGSRKFPLKDPFVELAKGSLNTFLNAMTFSDKTMYPIASMNDKDFENLMDVYLDAVFYPNIHKDPMILKQEGWHYELNDPKEDIIYKGVVYNEMKGAFSSPESVLFRKIQQSLFPDTAYNFESGGDPDYIPELTEETFLSFHKKYYHPSNSYIFLYGDIDVEEKLEWLNDNYLDAFERIEVDSEIKLQAPFKSPEEYVFSYPISSNETTKDKTYLSMNIVTGSRLSTCEYIGMEIIEYILLEAPGAPLKKALLDAGVGKDVFGSYDNSIMQPTFSIVAKNTEIDKKAEFVEIIKSTLKRISEEGLDKKKVEAAINYFEFKIKEADFGRHPKGVIYAIKALDSWLYDGSPFEYFEYNAAFAALKAGTEDGCLDTMIKKYFIDNTHVSILTLEPDTTLLSSKDEETKKVLANYKSKLKKKQILGMIEETKALETYQNSEETPEAIASIPLLELSDVDHKIEVLDKSIKEVKKTNILRHHAFTNNILYMKWLFDLSMIEENDLPYVKLLSKLLSKMNTENYSYSDLSDEINTNTGGISFSTQVYDDSTDPESYRPKLEISGKCFIEKSAEMIGIVEEIILNTRFDEVSRLKELIQESKSRVQMGLTSNGHVTTATRAESYFSSTSKVRDLFSGIGYYDFLVEIEKTFNDDADSVISHFDRLTELIFRGRNLLIGTTHQEVFDEKVDELLEEHLDIYDHETEVALAPKLILSKENEGFMTSDKIQYVAKAGNYRLSDFEYHGSMKVLQVIISLDYLWTNIRIKGGAYGAMVNFRRNGDMFFVSYRDPNLVQTIHHYDVMCDYIEHLEMDDRELRKYILGAISRMDQPLTPSMENERVISQFVTGVSDELLQLDRDQVLDTTLEEIKGLYSLIQSTMSQNYLCVLGNETKITEAQDVFKATKQLYV